MTKEWGNDSEYGSLIRSRMTKKDRKRKEWILSQAENDRYCGFLIKDFRNDKKRGGNDKKSFT